MRSGNMTDRVIVSRHPAAVEFIRRELPEFADAPVLATATPEDVAGKDVAGNLPLDLAALANVVFAISFPSGNAPRGQEYSIEEMDAAGATIRAFRVLGVTDTEPLEEIVNIVLNAYEVGRKDGAQEAGWGPAVDRGPQLASGARALCRALGL